MSVLIVTDNIGAAVNFISVISAVNFIRVVVEFFVFWIMVSNGAKVAASKAHYEYLIKQDFRRITRSAEVLASHSYFTSTSQSQLAQPPTQICETQLVR